MSIKNIFLIIIVGFSANIFSQDIAESLLNSNYSQSKTSYLDSIKATFKRDKTASRIDSLWLNELTSLDLYDNFVTDIKNTNIDVKVDFELSTVLLKSRLAEMDAKSPFNIVYNEGLENIIKSFLKNRKKSFERLMGLSEYYFPLFEDALSKQNVPLEIKYLAVVESALNPNAVSRMGATGLWQFMFQTGKQYSLNIDSYVDERKDPLKASEAAAKYMTNMYKIFGDWDLVLASYNSGPGNVAKAIRRSNGQQNYWNIRKNLPRETQGYVPAFLATMYIYEYHKEHGIIPNRALVRHFDTDTIIVKKQMSFKQIADLLDIPIAQIKLLNPSYKLEVVPFYPNKNHFLRLPLQQIAVFSSNEEKIYAYLQHETDKKEKPYEAPVYAARIKDTASFGTAKVIVTTYNKTKYHTVKSGDNLGEISNKYNVSISDLKKWNKLKGNNIAAGKRLKVIVTGKQRIVVQNKTEPKPILQKEIIVKSDTIKTNLDNTTVAKTDTPVAKTQYYVVQKGENLDLIAKKHAVSVADLKSWNNMEDDNVMHDTQLKIRKNNILPEIEIVGNTETTYFYTVQSGDNLGKIAKKEGVTVAQLQSWNQLEGTNLKLGDKIFIKKPVNQGKTNNSFAAKDKKSTVLKANHYLVQKGDSLYTISKKLHGVSVSDLKKWNGISSNDLKPGMKLKING